MNHLRRTTLVSGAMLAAALWLLSTRSQTGTVAQAASDPWGRYGTPSSRPVPSGTRINVALGSNISSETANVGDAWQGTVTEWVMTQNEVVIPPGSEVGGVVTWVTPAEHSSFAMLELGVRSIRVNGRDESIAASAEPVIAGSPHARKLGAIVGGVAAERYRVVLPDGTVMSFTVSQTVVMR